MREQLEKIGGEIGDELRADIDTLHHGLAAVQDDVGETLQVRRMMLVVLVLVAVVVVVLLLLLLLLASLVLTRLSFLQSTLGEHSTQIEEVGDQVLKDPCCEVLK